LAKIKCGFGKFEFCPSPIYQNIYVCTSRSVPYVGRMAVSVILLMFPNWDRNASIIPGCGAMIIEISTEKHLTFCIFNSGKTLTYNVYKNKFPLLKPKSMTSTDIPNRMQGQHQYPLG
jgi:hypothetical protein